jgi:hypothetical protein
MQLQAAFEVQQILKRQQLTNPTPNLSIIRKVLFWDTNFDKIDWITKKTAVIKRVFERGNDEEIQEIIRFYGMEIVEKTIRNYQNDFIPMYKSNVIKFLSK